MRSNAYYTLPKPMKDILAEITPAQMQAWLDQGEIYKYVQTYEAIAAIHHEGRMKPLKQDWIDVLMHPIAALGSHGYDEICKRKNRKTTEAEQQAIRQQTLRKLNGEDFVALHKSENWKVIGNIVAELETFDYLSKGQQEFVDLHQMLLDKFSTEERRP